MESTIDAKKVFRECCTCSQTFGHLLNREFGHAHEMEERALDPLAGGIMNTGHQCGMLWGAALAIGAESFRRHNDLDQAIALAVTATQSVVESFVRKTNTVNCREITGYNLSSVLGLVKFGLKTMLTGMNNSPCFNLADDWAPEAVHSATASLSNVEIEQTGKHISCASEVVKNMGASNEEMAMVAGFAGGLGLSGNACGALSATIWMKALTWCKAHPGKTPPFFNNQSARKTIIAFREVTDSEMNCSKICGRNFKKMEEHSEFIRNGGCQKILEVLTQS